MATDRIASPTDLPRSSWGSALKRTLKGFKRRQARSLGGRADLLRGALAVPGPAGPWSRSSACSPTRRGVTKFLEDVIGSLGPFVGGRHVQGTDRLHHLQPWRRGCHGDRRRRSRPCGRPRATWSAFADTSNSIYEVEEGRPFWKLKPIQLVVTFVCVVAGRGNRARARGLRFARQRDRRRDGLSDAAVTAWQFRQVAGDAPAGAWDPARGSSTRGRTHASAPKWISGGTVLALVRVDRRRRSGSRSTSRTSAPTTRS